MARKKAPAAPPEFPHVEKATQYARAVLSGKIPACRFVHLACQRHFDDIKAGIWTFDKALAERICTFISLLPHTKGDWAKPKKDDPDAIRIHLEPWQCFFLTSIFGWVNDKGHRRFTRASLYVPRKNGKSQIGAAIGLYMLAADGEPGAEVFCGATTEDQAWKVFGPAKLMAQKTPNLCNAFGIEVNARNINVVSTASKFEPLIGNPGDGDSPHLAIIDEYHEHKTNSQYNAMRSGMGARKQPLLLVITTAGSDPASPCYDDWKSSQMILEGELDAPRHFALIYTIDKDDRWDSEAAAIKANPNYGVSVEREFITSELASARANARHQSRYKTKHLNVWVQAKDAFFNIERWRDCENEELALDDLEGEQVYIGMDLASKVDMAAVVVVVRPSPKTGDKWAVFGRFYLPEETVNEPEKESYRKWVTDGFLKVTDGAIIDFDVIKEDLLDLCSRFECLSLPYDPYQATKLVTELQGEGLPVIEMRPTILNLSDPMKMLDALIRDGKVVHDGNPVMTWMIGNVVTRTDSNDNVFPRKNRPEDKIDGPVALIMAMARAMVGEVAAPEPSAIWLGPGAYDDAGVRERLRGF